MQLVYIAEPKFNGRTSVKRPQNDAFRPQLPETLPLQSHANEEELRQLIEKYSPQLIPERRTKLLECAARRTAHYHLVLEDLTDPHNISAIIRSCEVFGLLHVHIIEEVQSYSVSPSILRGSLKWMHIHTYKNRLTCMQTLRNQGFRIAVASTHAQQTFAELDLKPKTAFYMGSELVGNHPDTVQGADVLFKIPQYGLTESLNVSVCAGVMLAQLDNYMTQQDRNKFCLQGSELLALQATYLMRSATDIPLSQCLDRH